MSVFSPFLRNRQNSGCSCNRCCLPRCPESFVHCRQRCRESLIYPLSRSFNCILAHFYPAIFDFLNKKRIIWFFIHFHTHFSVCSGYARHQLWSISSFWTTFSGLGELLRHLRGASGDFREMSRDARALIHAFYQSDKAPDKDKNWQIAFFIYFSGKAV